ncbi:MAG: hypothetical protein M3Z36_03565, partial [Acidobacteriota bacterium]|nr:hypothetical protein [Acidobacteriota bacterium]
MPALTAALMPVAMLFLAGVCASAQKPEISSVFWTFIGPQPTGRDASAVSGRVTAIAVNPRDPSIVYLGSAGGGVWKTADGGLHWEALTDYESSLVVGAIAIDPSNENTIYIGTGETNACDDCYGGAGILKSTDGGVVWKQLSSPFVDALGRGARIGSIAVSPADRNIVLAAVYFVGASGVPGIYRSVNAGASWTPVLSR